MDNCQPTNGHFEDVNPPFLAWATWRVFKIEQRKHGQEDREFLEQMFQKLIMTFTWWVNRKDSEDRNVFEGGFLGMDNICPFNRSALLPLGETLTQSDGTSWMGSFLPEYVDNSHRAGFKRTWV